MVLSFGVSKALSLVVGLAFPTYGSLFCFKRERKRDRKEKRKGLV